MFLQVCRKIGKNNREVYGMRKIICIFAENKKWNYKKNVDFKHLDVVDSFQLLKRTR